MSANYNCLLFDIDGTLLDFKAAEHDAIRETLSVFDLPTDEHTAATFSEINAGLWAALERGEIKKDKLVVQRFSKLLDVVGAEGDPVRINNEYMTRLSNGATTYPGAEELLNELAEFATLAAITNGSKKVQMNRLEKSRLLPYFDEVFVSEKLGVTKPAARFFELTLKQLGIKNKEKVLVIGDSLAADIQGGINASLDTCWCNYDNGDNDTNINPTHTVKSLVELKLIAVGEEELKLAETREKRHIV